MKCQISRLDHSECPVDADGKRGICYMDPCGVMAEHAKTIKFTVCGNEAIPGDYICEVCRNQYNEYWQKHQKALAEKAAAEQAAADAAAALDAATAAQPPEEEA